MAQATTPTLHPVVGRLDHGPADVVISRPYVDDTAALKAFTFNNPSSQYEPLSAAILSSGSRRAALLRSACPVTTLNYYLSPVSIGQSPPRATYPPPLS